MKFYQSSTGWTVQFSKPRKAKKFYILLNVQTSSAVTLPLFDGELDSFPWIKKMLYSAEVNIEWSNTSISPYTFVFMAWLRTNVSVFTGARD